MEKVIISKQEIIGTRSISDWCSLLCEGNALNSAKAYCFENFAKSFHFCAGDHMSEYSELYKAIRDLALKTKSGR